MPSDTVIDYAGKQRRDCRPIRQRGEVPNSTKRQMTIIRVGTDNYHHQSGAKELTPEFKASINAAELADHLLREEWMGRCEIIPDYMPPYPRKDTQPRCVVRIAHYSNHPNREAESHSYLRHSCGPRQGFFWDIYGDDLHSVELAILALHQAPAPYYTGATVFRIPLAPSPTPEGSKP